jgi:hypothetical protein
VAPGRIEIGLVLWALGTIGPGSLTGQPLSLAPVAQPVRSFAGAQQGCRFLIRDRSGSPGVRLEGDGSVRGAYGGLLGRLDRDGVARDRSGSLLGRIDQSGVLRDRNGSLLARLEEGGTLRDGGGSIRVRLAPDGSLRDRTGALLGRAEGMTHDCLHAAAAVWVFYGPL